MFGNPHAAHAASVILLGAPNITGDQKDGAPLHAPSPAPRPQKLGLGATGTPPGGGPALALTHGRGGPGCPQPLQKELPST